MYVVGVPQETKQGEFRVSLTPQAIKELIANCKCRVLIESGAGRASGFEDEEYQKVGAKIVPWKINKSNLQNTDLIVKVKEPLPPELPMLIYPKNKIVAGFFHFGANPQLLNFFQANNIGYFDYGEVSDEDGYRPILAAMSRIAGQSAVLEGFHYLHQSSGGRGIMPQDAIVTIVGAGVAGMAAAEMVANLHVKNLIIFDRDIEKLVSSRFVIKMASAENIKEVLPKTDILIGAAAAKGKLAPKIFTRAMIASMSRGAVFVDISIDEGGSSETSRPTTHADPFYIQEGVVHVCITNLPGVVPITASRALSKALLPHLISLISRLSR
ncbi:MAG: NAD(P)-dependent oxidoreductase [Patescibacteria group bacterium]